MAGTEHAGIARVAVVGTGVIGASWASYFLAQGLDVTATDPAPDAEAKLRAAVVAHWPVLERMGLRGDASPERLTFAASLEDAVKDVGLVQENGPEREEVKQETYRRLDAATDPATILATSSSGLLVSRIQAACPAHPERVVLGHPFNPPHLIPLVEVLGGEKTAPEAVERAFAFYASIGKRPIRVNKEVPGHIANRLQAALWREAFHLVDTGVASVSDIDTAIAHGPGLRWALLGPFLNLHLSGGAGGIRYNLDHLGPAIESWWHTLGAPLITDELKDKVVAGVAAELEGLAFAETVSERDHVLLDLLREKAQAANLP